MQTAYSLQQLEAGLRSPTDCNSSCMQQNLNFLYSRHFPKETMQQIKWKSSFFSQLVYTDTCQFWVILSEMNKYTYKMYLNTDKINKEGTQLASVKIKNEMLNF